MQWILLASAITADPVLVERFPTSEMAAEVLSREVKTGTLLFTQGDCLAVKMYTKSPYTHVGAVVVKDGKICIYDSNKGSGVRCQSLDKYLAHLGDKEIHVFHPKKEFSRRRREQFVKYLISQLGREYSIKHHLTGKRADGVHCSEYVTDALSEISLIHANQPSKVSPASLVEGLIQSDLYTASKTIALQPEPRETSDSRMGQAWIDTKACTKKCYYKMRGWIFCH